MSLHTYHHMLIPDVSAGCAEYDFDSLNNQCTDVFYASGKESGDSYMAKSMDDVLSSIPETDGYVYVLDDDNILSPRFLDISPFCTYDAVVFRVCGRPKWGCALRSKVSYVGRIDWSNFVTRLPVMRRLKIHHAGEESQQCDGLFFDRLVQNNCSVRFLSTEHAYYNYLSRKGENQ